MIKSIKIQQWLESNNGYTIDIFNMDTQQVYVRKLNYTQLMQEAENLDVLIQSVFLNHNVEKLGIQKYKPNGTSNKRYMYPITVLQDSSKQENLPKEVVNETVQPSATVSQPTVAPPVSTPIAPQQHNYGMGAGYGMSMPEVIDLHTKAKRYDDLREDFLDLKTKYRKLEGKNDDLEVKKRQLEAELAIAEKQKEVALLEKGLEKQPAIDPEVLSGIMGVLKEAVPHLMSKGSVTQGGGMAGAENNINLSEEKKALIFIVKSDQFPNNLAEELSYFAVGFKQSEEFTKEAQELLIKHKIKNLV